MKYYKNVLIVGDFNLPELHWIEGFAVAEGVENSNCPLLDCLHEHSLYQAIDFPTRYRSGQNPTLIDLLFINDHEMLISVDLEPPFGASDHVAIICRLRLYPQKNNWIKHMYTNYNQVRHELANQDWSFIDDKNMEEAWLEMKRVLIKATEKHTVISWKRRPKTLPFIIVMSSKLYGKRRSIGANIKVAPPMKIMKNLNIPGIKLGMRKTEYEEGLALDSKSNPKRFWKYASAQNPGRHSVTELLVNGNIVSTPNNIAAE